MKFLKIMVFMLSLPLVVSAQQPTVKAKTKLNINFDKYKTFTWTEMAASNDFINDAIRVELLARGYREQDMNSDLIVSYRVLDKRTRVTGFNSDAPTMVAGEQVRQIEDTTTYVLEPGTLMISLIDRRTSEVVWDGFASGLATPDSFSTRPEKAKVVVRMIFEEFEHRATPIDN